MKVLINCYHFTKIYDLKFLENETTALWIFFFFFFFFLKLARKSLLLLKCILAGCSNGNESFTGRLFSNYRPLNMLFHFFFDISFIVFFTFVNKFINKLSFFSSSFKNLFQDVVYYRNLGSLTLWYWNGGPLNIR